MNINMKHDNKAVILWESCDYFPVKIHLFWISKIKIHEIDCTKQESKVFLQ